MGQVLDLDTGNISNDPSNTRSIMVTKVVNGTNVDSSSYAQKLSPMPFTKATLRKLDVDVPNYINYDIWLSLASFHKEKYGLKKVTLVKDLDTQKKQFVLNTSGNLLFAGKGGSSRVDDEGFTKVKKKRSGCNNGGTKNFKLISVKPKTTFLHKENQPTAEVSHKITLSIGKKNVSTSGNSLKKESKMTVLTYGNHIVSLSNSFDALNDERKCVLVFDDGKPLEKVDYSSDHDSDDEVAYVDNKMANILAAKTLGVGYERLGLGYLFTNDITRALSTMTNINIVEIKEKENNVYAISLRFRLLKQHGYNVSQDFIKRFKDSKGDFIRFLKTDLKGLINLYEASYLDFEGEMDLHEAKLIAIEYLPDFKGQEYGAHELDANILMLELAALDFNMVQSELKTDLQELSKWWKNIGLASKLSFIMDRLMKCFFWTVGVVFEPQYYSCRGGISKVRVLITVIDDIYDVYGSLDELKIFTDVVKGFAVLNHIVLSVKDKLTYLEHPIPIAPVLAPRQVLPQDVLAAHATWVKASKELNRNFFKPLELFIRANMKAVMSLILVSLSKEYDGFVQNYNMHGMGKTVNELHAMLKLHEQTLPKKDDALVLHAIRAWKGKTEIAYAPAYAPKPKIHPPPKKDNPAKDVIYYQCGEEGHWQRNCLEYLAELMKKKKLSQGYSTSSITYKELYDSMKQTRAQTKEQIDSLIAQLNNKTFKNDDLKAQKFSKDFLNTSESSNDDFHVVSMRQEPIVFNQDPSENSSQSPPQIDHHCCSGCGNSLDGIFCQRCTSKSCGKDENSFAYDSTPNLVKDSPNVFNPPSQPPMYSNEFCGDDAHYSYDCPLQVLFIYDPEPCYNQDFNFPQNFQSFQQQYPCCENCGDPYETFQSWLQQQKDQGCQKIPLCYDDEDDEESSIPLRDIIIFELPSCIEIIPVVSTKDSLIMGDEHLDTIPEKESDEFIKSSVENLVPNPSKSEDERECNVPACDDFTTFSNLLFDADDDFSSKSLLNQDSSIISSSKIDSLLVEFAGELILLNSIPPGINEADCDPKEEIRLIEKLLYDNSSPRLPKEFIYENSDVAIESFSPSPILVEDSDSLMEEIDLFLTLDDSMPPGIEDDDYDSEGDILILEELLSNDSLSLTENESFHFDIPSSPRPPAKPPDDDEIKPNSGCLTVKVVGDIYEHYVHMPRLLPNQPTLASNQEKSPHLLSHPGFKAFQLSSESPMMIYGGNIPILDVLFLYFYPP
nr:(E)-beta-ocimene synthase, chloroplastic-like [Tanacetum cinerariifolium]